MDATDSRTRGKFSLYPSTVLPSSIPGPFVSEKLLFNVASTASFWLIYQGAFAHGSSVFWVLSRTLACGALGSLLREASQGNIRKRASSLMADWPVIALSSLVCSVRNASLLTALMWLPPTRVSLFVHYSITRVKPSGGSLVLLITLSYALAFVDDLAFSSRPMGEILLGYIALLSYTASTAALHHLLHVSSLKMGADLASACSALGAFFIVLFASSMSGSTSAPKAPIHILLVSVFLFAYSMQAPLNPFGSRSQAQFTRAYPWTLLFSLGFGAVAFSTSPSTVDAVIGVLVFCDMLLRHSRGSEEGSRFAMSSAMHSHLKSIMNNSESRRIFYFLLLNLAFMLVQMLYGIWTNSLGLISDAIHMGFDCLAIGVGLFASVMALWPPNERFTYAYGRMETLSGFANGLFLILISIFIVFEAIQRLLEPPEMSTKQLLLISTLGLGVNLFGMFATGGHHHHGHGHGHGHGHEHEQLHGHHHQDGVHSREHSVDHACLHDHSHGRDHDRDHDHTHSYTYRHGDDQVQSPGSGVNVPSDEHVSGKRPFNHAPPSLQLKSQPLIHARTRVDDLADSMLPTSPITPSYRFGVDEHFATHHHHHTPNLHDHSHTHSHSHEGHSHNMRGVFLHVMADTLGSVGVIISTLLIQFYGWTGFDPIASLLIALLIAASVVPLVLDTGRVLALDVSDRDRDVSEALAKLSSVEGLKSYSSPRFWPKDSSTLIGSIHIQLFVATQISDIVQQVDRLLRSHIQGLEELTIQVEDVDSFQ